MKFVQARFSSKRQGWPAVAVLAALSFAVACSEVPTGSTSGVLEQVLLKGRPKPPPQQQDVTVTITDADAGMSGVFSDGGSAGFADYVTGDPGSGNLNLRPQCDPGAGRHVFLRNLLEDFPRSSADIPTCNDPGWMFLHLPEIMVVQCSVYPCDYGADEPSYVVKGKGVLKPTGWMSPTVNFFFQLNGINYNLVWQDAELLDPPGGARRVTGGTVRLYDSTNKVLDENNKVIWIWEGDVELNATVTPIP